MKYICPVCGFNELNEPPRDWIICPCCLTEFDYSNASWTYAELRQDWIEAGAQWGTSYIPKPVGWSAVRQLRNIRYECTWADLQEIHLPEITWVSDMVVAVSEGYGISITCMYRPTVTPTHSQVVALFAPAIRMDNGRHPVNSRSLPNGLLVCQNF